MSRAVNVLAQRTCWVELTAHVSKRTGQTSNKSAYLRARLVEAFGRSFWSSVTKTRYPTLQTIS